LAGKDITEIICVVDHSGSMADKVSDAVGGLNTLVSEQAKLPGECLFTYVEFSGRHHTKIDRTLVQNVAKFTERSYALGGCTALYDALASTILRIEDRIANTPDKYKPSAVVFVILTDGEENASRNYSSEEVKKLVSKKSEEGWKFIYLAQDIDAFASGNAMGFDQAKGTHFVGQMKSGAGGQSAGYTVASNAIGATRAAAANGCLDYEWSEE
jgi:uncharacterized protein YegL